MLGCTRARCLMQARLAVADLILIGIVACHPAYEGPLAGSATAARNGAQSWKCESTWISPVERVSLPLRSCQGTKRDSIVLVSSDRSRTVVEVGWVLYGSESDTRESFARMVTRLRQQHGPPTKACLLSGFDSVLTWQDNGSHVSVFLGRTPPLAAELFRIGPVTCDGSKPLIPPLRTNGPLTG
jgi:hypothetical protein